MKIIENNLKQFISIPQNISELTNSYITEVENFSYIANINGLVVGKVLEKEKHENADTLSVTKVDLGDRIEQIVCGAPNVAAGQYVIVATEGAVLPGNFVIKKSKIRGVESNGMICSLKELGIEEKLIPEKYAQGIYYFDEPKLVGSNPLEYLGLNSFVMELSLTPNRSDLLSHYGYAQDLAAVLETKIELPKFNNNESDKVNPLTVKIESTNTRSYYARYFDEIVIKESPWWLKLFLVSMNCQPINNVVDITNYILYTYGIPMHAFDAVKFGTKEIVVKDNKILKDIVTLDGIKRTITNNEIVITNGHEPMALGGVMGLENSMIDDNTKSVILEVASFDSESIRNTSKKLNLKSDSSLRFERGIDESIMMQALDHATSLLVELASARVYQGISKDVKKVRENPEIEVILSRINKKTGERIKRERVINILENLNYQVIDNDKTLIVKAPTYRHDINAFDDVLEEVIRIYGMDKIKNAPLKLSGIGGLTKQQTLKRKTRHMLASMGLNEVVTYSLMKEENVQKFNSQSEIITILRPLTNDRKALRQSLINGMLEVVKYNRDRSIENINIFEMGKIYAKGIEETALTILMTSKLHDNSWKKTDNKVDFYYMSGLLKRVLQALKVDDFQLIASENNAFHPFQQAKIVANNVELGIIGKIHPEESKKDCFAIEINLDKIVSNNDFKYEEVTKFPNVERDIAIVIKDEVKIGDIVSLIKQTTRKQLVKIEVFDVYKGNHIEEGYQSVAINMVFNDREKTLEGSDIDKIVNRVVKRIEFELGGKIRS